RGATAGKLRARRREHRWTRGHDRPQHITLVLPDGDALFRWPIHLVAFLEREGLVERVEVRQRPVRAEFVRRMRIRFEVDDLLLFARLVAPALRVAQKEAFVTGHPVDDGSLLAAKRQPIRLVRYRKAGQ